jgi:uroporphyrinogen decarboxylase
MVEAVSTPDIAAEVTLMPIRRLGFDAAILFSDLTVPFTPMGAPFDIKEGVGPVVEHPIRSQSDLSQLHLFEPEDGLHFVMETIHILKRELTVPLIGFTGAPFTLASYLIEGGPSKDHKLTRSLMLTEPKFWHELMALLAENTLRYLKAQIEAGADAVQLFDSWVGVLDEATYREYLLPHMKHIFEGLQPLDAPTIHFGTGTAALLNVMQEAGGNVIGVDWRISLYDAAKLVSPTPMQGNLDPAVLLTTPEVVKRQALKVVAQGHNLPGHIFNLGHGIYPNTPLQNVEALMEAVQGCKA